MELVLTIGRGMILSLSANNKLGFIDGSIEKPKNTSNEYKAWEC